MVQLFCCCCPLEQFRTLLHVCVTTQVPDAEEQQCSISKLPPQLLVLVLHWTCAVGPHCLTHCTLVCSTWAEAAVAATSIISLAGCNPVAAAHTAAEAVCTTAGCTYGHRCCCLCPTFIPCETCSSRMWIVGPQGPASSTEGTPTAPCSRHHCPASLGWSCATAPCACRGWVR